MENTRKKEVIRELQILLENASEDLKFAQPSDETQFAYNEGIEDLSIKLEEMVTNRIEENGVL